MRKSSEVRARVTVEIITTPVLLHDSGVRLVVFPSDTKQSGVLFLH